MRGGLGELPLGAVNPFGLSYGVEKASWYAGGRVATEFMNAQINP